MLSFFNRSRPSYQPLLADVHSHLVPGIDDGVKTPEEAFGVIDRLIEMGYSKIITTPHIMSDYYGNTAESITQAYRKFLPLLREKGYSIPFEVAAEYYLDEKIYDIIRNRELLLTFGDRFLLFETNAVSEPLQLKEFIFSLTSQGIKPVMAHPERYQYMNFEKAQDLMDRGVLFQVNLLSLIGYYGPPIQRFAERLIDRKWVSMLGSDCHNMDHATLLTKVLRSRSYKKALELPLLNNTL